jgi:hypothetical protein
MLFSRRGNRHLRVTRETVLNPGIGKLYLKELSLNVALISAHITTERDFLFYSPEASLP